MISWLKDRLINVIFYGVVILASGFMLYSAFLKPTNNQKTVNQAGSVSNHFYEHAQIKSTFGCQSLGAEKFMKALKENK